VSTITTITAFSSTSDAFRQLGPAARVVLADAEDEARRLNHADIGASHVLLGVLREGGPAAGALVASGVTLAGLRTAVLELTGRGLEPVVGELPLTPCGAHVFEQAAAAARRHSHPCVAPEHLLLALLQDAEEQAAGGAARALKVAGVSAGDVRRRTEAILAGGA
jgi:ATP-dependent Clp protease ATP-binding subunit ClpC